MALREDVPRSPVLVLVGGSSIVAVIVLLLALAFSSTSMAAYVDSAHARTAPIPAAVEASLQPGLAKNSRMVDTGLGLSQDGNVYVWGLTSSGINGGATNPGGQRPPQQVPLPAESIRQVTGGIYNANALDEEGTVWGWGAYNDRDGTNAAKPNGNPRQIRVGTAWNGTGDLLSGMLSISSTEQAGAGIRSDGSVWHWGSSTGYGGNSGSGASRLTGLPDPSVAGNRPVYLKGAYTNFFVVLENGDVYYWGGAGGSSLPSGASNVNANATLLTQLNPWMKRNTGAGNPHIVAVDGGINMGAALLSNGQLVSWGSDASRTGRGGPTSPAVIPTLSGITSMQFGFTGVVMIDGQSRLWGYGASDDYGRLPSTPTQVDSNIKQFAAGQGYYLWQKNDGTYWGRGYNPQGAIGLPTGTQSANRQVSWNLEVLG